MIARALRFINPFLTTRHSSPLPSSLHQNQNGSNGIITWTKIGSRYFSSAVEVSEFDGDALHDIVKATEKVSALHLALSQLAVAGDFCDESRLSFQRFFGARRRPAISTGSLKLDIALGIGGLPKGRIVEIYGREASGKTTLALHVIKEAQKLGGYCAYLDVENALDPMLAESIGVNTEDLLISQPDCAENLLSMVDTLTKSGSVDVVVVDSVAALIPRQDIDLVIGDKKVDLQSEIMTKALRKINYSLSRSETIIIFVNQVRFRPGKDQGFAQAKEVTCGGNALPFYSAVRLRMIRKRVLKTNDKITGLEVCVEVVKNKLAPAMKTAELGIHFGRGFWSASEILELGCEQGCILKEGDNYFIDGEVLHSKEDAETYLDQNDPVRDKLVKTIRSQLFPENKVKKNH